MSRPQLNIKFDGDGEKEFLETVKARATDERLTLKEFVIDALKMRLEAKAPTQSTQARPAVTKSEFEALKKKVLDQAISTSIEFKKDREQIAVLADVIASIEARLADIVPLAPTADDEDTQDRQARQSNWREWEEHCEPGTGAWDTWNSDAVEFLDSVSWGNANG